MRNAVTGEAIPPRSDPEIFYRIVAERCWLTDVIFRSRYSTFAHANPGATLVDYIFAVLKPDRDSGVPRTFANVAEAAAFILAQPVPDEPSQAAKEREQAEVLIRSIEK